MTKNLADIRAEIAAEFQKKFVKYEDGENGLITGEPDEVIAYVIEAIDRVARETKDTIVPNKREMDAHECGSLICTHYPRTGAHNSCVETIEENFKSFME